MKTRLSSRHGRIADGKVRVCSVMPEELRDAMREIAKREHRSLSNWMVTQLETAVDDYVFRTRKPK